MSRFEKLPADLIELMLAAAEGSVGAAELARLEHALSNDDNAAQLFLHICQLEADLRLHEMAASSTQQVVRALTSPLSEVSSVPWLDGQLHDDGSRDSTAALGTPHAFPRTSPPLNDSQKVFGPDSLLASVLLIVSSGAATLCDIALQLWEGGKRLMSRPTPLCVTVAAFLLACLPFLTGSWVISSSQHTLAKNAQEPFIGRVSDLRDVQWVDGNTAPSGLSSLVPGQHLEIASGLAEITFHNGAKVLLEGPSHFIVGSSIGGEIAFGRLTAHVPSTGVDFSLRMPGGQVTDEHAGAEFAVEVGRDGASQEVHVFVGRITVSIHEAAGSPARTVLALRSGSGVRLPSTGRSVEPIAADAGRFTRLIDSQHVASLLVSSSYVSTIKAAHPLAYWRFERAQDAVVPNEINGSSSMRIGGSAHLSGPKGSGRIAIPAGDADGWLYADKPLAGLRGDYSIELWVNPEADVHACLIGLISHNRSPNRPSNESSLLHSALLEMTGTAHEWAPSRVVRFLHRSPPGVGGGVNVFSAYPIALHRWHHLVAVKRGAEMCLYINGMLTAAEICDSNLTSDPLIVLGRLHTVPGPDSRRQFIGELDEIAIYGRALNSDEVRKHFDSGRRGAGNQASDGPSNFSPLHATSYLKGAT